MVEPRQLDDLAQRLSQLLPPGLAGMRDELERNVRAVLQQALSKMDLVSREEFEVQQAVLQRTRSKLENLEKQLAELEAGLK